MKKLSVITIIISIISLSLSYGAVSASKARDISQTMSDETSSYSYFDSIKWGYESGIFDGFKDGSDKGKFLPYNPITRAEFLKMLFNARHDDISVSYDKKCFGDSGTGTWYNKFLCYSKEKGYIKGYDNGLFKPNDSITVAEAYKILVNAYGFSASNDIMEYVFDGQWTGGVPITNFTGADKFDVNPSKWYYPYFSIAHNMGIRFDEYFSKRTYWGEVSAIPQEDRIRDVGNRLDRTLTRGQMINMIYQFQAIAESKALADTFISGFKEKNGSKMYPVFDSASRSLELSESRFSGIVSEFPIQIISSEFKGAFFYNGVSKTYFYKDLSGAVYSRNALRLGYEVYAKLGDGSASEIIKLNFYPVFILENGEWRLHEEANRFYKVAVSENSLCEAAKSSKIYGFMGYMVVQSLSDLCSRSSYDKQENITESIGSYKYGIYTVNDSGRTAITHPLGTDIGIPKIGDSIGPGAIYSTEFNGDKRFKGKIQ